MSKRRTDLADLRRRKRATWRASLIATAALVIACELPVLEANLRTDAAHVCRAGQSLVLSRSGQSQYRLGPTVLDSAQLQSTLALILAPRPSKMILVDIGPRPARAPLWIVSAIRQAGGDAFELDSACVLPAIRLTAVGPFPGAQFGR